MQASIDGTVIADAPESDLIQIEGNSYFPPSAITSDLFSDSPTPYTCPWKGPCQYHDVTIGDARHHDAAWSYPNLRDGAVERVGKDFAGYVAFDKAQVTLT